MNKLTKILIGVIVILLFVIGFGVKVFLDGKKIDEALIREENEVLKLEEKVRQLAEEGIAENLKVIDGVYTFEVEEGKDVVVESTLFHTISKDLFEPQGKRVEFINNNDEVKFVYEFRYYYYPKLAILIDDVGYNTKSAYQFNELGMKINFAILPFLSKSREAGDILREAGHTTILHMPMEGSNATLNDRTEGMIYERFSPKEIFDNLDRALEDVGPVKGFNNHMGSKFTSNEEQMRVILQYANNKGLYFVDSNTSRRNKGYSVAKEIGMPTFQCSHFLDNSREISDIEKEILTSLQIAKDKGEALVIGHYHANMAEALANTKEAIENSGVKLVYIEEILE